MAGNDPWAAFNPKPIDLSQPTATAGAPQPVFTVPDPRGDAEQARKDDAEVRANADAVRAEETLRLAKEKAARDADPSTSASVEERKAGSFLLRALGANDQFEAQHIGARSLIGQKIADNTPNFLNSLPESVGNSPERQVADQAQREFIAATLRQDSGAAIPDPEIINQQRIYFPQPGDGPKVIEAKRQSRLRAIEGLKEASGRMAPQVLAGFHGQTPPEQRAREPEMAGGVPAGSDIKFGMDGDGPQGGFDRNDWLKKMGLDPDEEAEIVAFWNANRGNKDFTVPQAKKWFADRGFGTVSEENLASAVRDARKGATFTAMDSAAAKAAYEAKLDAESKRRREASGDGQPGMMDLATQGVSGGLGDEAAGVGGVISSAIGASNRGAGEGYTFERDLRRRELEQAGDRTGIAGDAVELLGNAAGMGASAVNALPTTARAAMGEAALAGAVPGFGYGEGAQDSLGGAAIGAGAGAALGRLFHGIGARARNPKPPGPGAPVIEAADRLNAKTGSNIRPIPADVSGPGVRNATGGMAKFPLSAAPIVNAGKAVNAEAQVARDALAAGEGTATELETAGEAALTGARAYMKRSKAKVDSLYTRARKLGGEDKVPLTQAQKVLDDHIAELEKTPGGAKGLDDLKSLGEEIKGDWTVDGIKRMRTQLRDKFLDQGLRGSDLERRVGQVIDAAELDVADGLIAAGKPEAAKAYAEAANAHRERVQTIDNVIAPIIGKRGDAPKSGEQIMAAINGATKQNNARLGEFIGALPPEDAATVRATIISQLGKGTNGTQNAAGDAFSLPQFLTHWNAMTPGAKRTLFGGEVRAALDDLAVVADGAKQSQRFANHSNTGSPLGIGATGAGAMSIFAHPVLTIGGLLTQYGGGRLLASPAFARWIARVPKSGATGAVKSHIASLSKIASADTAIAADALGLQRQLMAAFDAGPMPLAANSDSRNGDEATTKTSAAGQ